LQFNHAHDLIKKLIKRKILFHLVLIKNFNLKVTHKRSSVINSIYSGQHFLILLKEQILTLLIPYVDKAVLVTNHTKCFFTFYNCQSLWSLLTKIRPIKICSTEACLFLVLNLLFSLMAYVMVVDKYFACGL
jgi:hypothetical protein